MVRLSKKRVIAAVGTLVLIAAIAFVVEAVLAGLALRAARTDGSDLAARLSAGDIPGAEAAARRLERDGHRAHVFTVGPLWWIGDRVPFLGKNVSAVQDTASALNAISSNGMPLLITLADEAKSGTLRLHDGRLSTQAIASFAPALRRAANAIDPPATRVERISAGSLLPPLNTLLKQVQTRVSEAKTSIDAAANAFEVLPEMLGGNGPRTYLLLVQNPAEIRSSGGLPGTWAFLRADRGKLSMVKAEPGVRYTTANPPLPLTAEESALFGSDMGTSAGSLTFSPDFPRVAQLAAKMAALHGMPVDGVFSVDPVALSYVLRGTGPVQVAPGMVLNASNAVSTLLNKVYLTLPNEEEQNAFYLMAAQKIFDSLLHGSDNEMQAIRGLVEGVQRHRVFAWSPDPSVAKVIDGTGLSGAFPTDTGNAPQVGMFLNSAIASKSEYYLQQSSTVTAISCKGGVQTLRLESTFRSTMPRNAVHFPLWVVGSGAIAPKGDLYDSIYVAGPWKGTVQSLTVDGKPQTITSNQLDGRQIAITSLQLVPGQQATVVATLTTGPGQTGAGQLTWTPGMTSAANPTTFSSACG